MMTVMFEATTVEPVLVRLEIFSLWLHGYTASEAITNQTHSMMGFQRKNSAGTVSEGNPEEDRLRHCIRHLVRNQYDVYGMLETLLQEPTKFRTRQPLLQVSPYVFSEMVQRYYTLDDNLLREIAGRRLTKVAKEVDLLSERTGVRVASCERQIENLRLVSRCILGEDEKEERGVRMVAEIRHRFDLSEELATKYARFLFLSRYRFETLKKRLRLCLYSDLEKIAAALMSYWTVSSSDDIDHEFFETLREVKLAIASERNFFEQYRRSVEAALQGQTDKASRIGARCVSITKALCTIATSLSRSKELRDFFGNMIEQVVNPLCRIILDPEEIIAFFEALSSSFQPTGEEFTNLIPAFERYIRVVSIICSILYPRYLKHFSQRLRWLK